VTVDQQEQFVKVLQVWNAYGLEPKEKRKMFTVEKSTSYKIGKDTAIEISESRAFVPSHFYTSEQLRDLAEAAAVAADALELIEEVNAEKPPAV